MTLEKWVCGEISFAAKETYEDPVREVSMEAVFTAESGKTLVRPCFWDGGTTWRVRIALTETGMWRYCTRCTNHGDSGLHGLTGTVECVPYTGQEEIYRHGFVRISENGHYFVYDDGTPFFYLGDTHWLMPQEKWDTSNAEGIDSQFRYAAEYRKTQGFTVYQSEPIGMEKAFGARITEQSVAAMQELDKKFAFLAENGFVHANAQLFFTPTVGTPNYDPECYTPEYLARLATLWSARYGAYPVLWTTAQESDPDFYGGADIQRWQTIAESLHAADCYQHPLTAHMCNDGRCFASNTVFGRKKYHSWFALQAQGISNQKYFEDLWRFRPAKPLVNYETGYEGLWNGTPGAVYAGYHAFLGGMCGYGYGAHGVWNNDYSTEQWMDYGGYYRWLEGLHLPGGKALQHLRTFFARVNWWELEPHFLDEKWNGLQKECCLATIGQDTYLAGIPCADSKPGKLRNMKHEKYYIWWYNILKGTFIAIDVVMPEKGELEVPAKPDDNPWVLVATTDADFPTKVLCVNSTENELLFRGDSLQMSANQPVRWTSLTPEKASVDETGRVTALGQNGMAVICAVGEKETVQKRILLLRQGKTEAPAQPKSIGADTFVHGGRKSSCISAEEKYMQVLPSFEAQDCWNQMDYQVVLQAPDGSKCLNVIADASHMLYPICDGPFRVRLEHRSGLVSPWRDCCVEGHGAPSLTLGATATCDDYHEHYDARCLPQSAVNGRTSHFTGWCSEKVCTPENPAVLTVTMEKENKINCLKLYTTDLGYTLADFELFCLADGCWKSVGRFRDNKETEVTVRFDAVSTREIQVRCYHGDLNGNARVDQLNAYCLDG